MKRSSTQHKSKKSILSLLTIGILFISQFAIAQPQSLMKADKYYELFAFEQAIPFYLDALKIDENNTRALSRLGDCYRLTGNLDNASSWYGKAMNRADKKPMDIYHYAQMLKSTGMYDEAKLWFNDYARFELEKGSHFAKSCDFAKSNKDGNPPFEVQKVATNSTASDFGPAFFGDQVVLSSFRKDKINPSGNDEIIKDSYNMLYITNRLSDGGLSSLKVLKTEYRSESNQCFVSYRNGKVAFVKNNNNFTNGVLPLAETGVKMDIYLANANTAGIWEEVIPFTFNGVRYSNSWPFLAKDGKTMYFASNAPGGYGGYDIYTSTYQNGTWSEPKNLGSRVNSAGNEISPFLENGVLYFSSDWHMGFGGLDIFKSQLVDGVWSKITNMGDGINGPQNDYSFIFDANKEQGYFTSNRKGSRGNDDIYKVTFDGSFAFSPVTEASPSPITDTVIEPGPSSSAPITTTSTPSVPFYTGKIVNSETEDALAGVRVLAKNKQTGTEIQTTTNSKGIYDLPLKKDFSYLVGFSKVGYLNTDKTVNVDANTKLNFLGSLEMEPSPISTEKPETEVTSSKPLFEETVKGVNPITSTVDMGTKPIIPDVTPKGGGTTTTTETNKVVLKSNVFEVQVGVYKSPSMSKLRSLGDLGMVYGDERGDVTAYKVGTFEKREDAAKAQKEIVKRGFKGAFVRKVTENNPIVNAITSMTNAKDEPVTSGPSTSTPSSSPSASNEKGLVFKVQLGAYKDPAKIAIDNRLNNWGDIQMEKISNGLTRILLGNFENKKAADKAKVKAIEYGVQGAYVVAYRDGRKISMKSLPQ